MNLIERLAQRVAAQIGEPVDEAGRQAAAEAAAMQLIDEGNELEDQGRLDDALAFYENAVRLAPGLARGHLNVGNICYARGDLDGAIEAYRRGLMRQPDHAGGHYNLGNALLAARQPESALAAHDRALAANPQLLDAEVGRAAALEDLGRKEEAAQALRAVLGKRPDWGPIWGNLALLLAQSKRPTEAAEAYGRLLALQPDHLGAAQGLLDARLSACDWATLDHDREQVLSAIAKGRRPVSPFQLLAITADDATQTRAAALYLGGQSRKVRRAPAKAPASSAGKPIRIGYLSPDFRNHPVATLMAGVIESHDRAQFEVFGFSIGPDDGGAMRRRLVSAFDHFVDGQHANNGQLADHVRECGIDVLIDLAGHTTGARPGVLAEDAAPIQVNWLGYPGSLGAAWADYLIADRHVIPANARERFSEQIVWLPHSYQSNDDRREIGSPSTRSDAGLPEDAFVFCCFNNSWKIQPPMFRLWMRLLTRVPNSVLWLLEDNADAARQLRKESERAGIAPERLVFAGRKPPAEHLARHALADLFLDTLPYNAHTTGSDALWAGLPLITCRGGSFAGRVASSLLHAVGLPELITEDLAAYEALAIALASDRERLASLRRHLIEGRTRFPLFDTRRFTRHFEACLQHMVDRQRRGLAPAAFAVRADGTIEEGGA
jgi:predicted O-linked N-acetylglucosamine transferase (SPINDLY family)